MAREPRELITIPDANPKVVYNVSTPTTEFTFNFPYWDDDDITVNTRPSAGGDWTLRADYTITPATGFAQTGYGSGTVTMDSSVNDVELCIQRAGTFNRLSQFQPGVALDVYAVNRDLNRLVGLLQTVRMNTLMVNPCEYPEGFLYYDPVDGFTVQNAGIDWNQPEMSFAELADDDLLLVYDQSAGITKILKHRTSHWPVLVESTTARQISNDDLNSFIKCLNSGATTITIPSGVGGAGSAFSVGKWGTGSVTVAAGASVAVRAPNGASCAQLYSVVQCLCVALDEWVVTGDSA